jgi:fatty-acyl-CoA synthase
MSEHEQVWKDPLSPVVFLERTLRVFPERTAVIHGSLRWTYRQLAEEVGRMAGALRASGIAEGDRVAILSPNTPWHLAAHFAAPLLAAPLVSINIRLAGPEIAYILEHSGARTLLIDPEYAHLIDDAREEIPTLARVIEIDDGFVPVRPGKEAYTDFVRGAEVLPIRTSVDDEDTLLSINYTSGTTGMPKGVMYTHRGAHQNALGQAQALGLNRDTVFLWTLPMFHCNGWCMPWAVVAAGGAQVGLRKVDPPLVFKLIEEHGVTNFNGAPTVLLMLSSDPSAEGRRFDPPICVCTGGAPPSPSSAHGSRTSTDSPRPTDRTSSAKCRANGNPSTRRDARGCCPARAFRTRSRSTSAWSMTT